jgi:hypothetical protein
MQSRIIRFALPLTVLVCALLAPGLAGAQQSQQKKPYQSAMRAQCEQELAKDVAWQAELHNALRPVVHQADATLIAKNHRHVVMAYASLWGLTVIFLVLLWLRQRRLVAEMDRLGQQIAKAASE